MRLLDLLDCIDMVLLLLRNLLIEVRVELCDELLMRFAQFFDLISMLGFKSFNFIAGCLAQASLEGCKFGLVCGFHCSFLFLVLGSQHLGGLAGVRLQPLNLPFEFRNKLALVFHDLVLFICELLLEVHDLLLELLDSFLQFHLQELFVTTCIVPELREHALILFLELLYFSSVLLCQVCLQLVILLLGLRLVRFK